MIEKESGVDVWPGEMQKRLLIKHMEEHSIEKPRPQRDEGSHLVGPAGRGSRLGCTVHQDVSAHQEGES